ncbi:hypothetical protein LCGC14_2778860 [marine sediment metagenome]|uniref:Uncharacterized protein n=1 Tax=marine sediment metagenome TaxID=412755 RepID=A0A0F8ZFX9_9ZZZZ
MPENSGAPEEGTVTAEQRQEAAAAVEGTQQAAGILSGDQIEAHMDEEYISFVAAPEHANDKILVKAGTEVRTPQEGTHSPGVRTRDGDIKARFTNGVLVTKDPVVIKWCDEHPSICRRADGQFTRSWATLKEMATRRANRDPLEDASNMSADEAFPSGGLDDLRAEAAKTGSIGDNAVENALQTKKSVEGQK